MELNPKGTYSLLKSVWSRLKARAVGSPREETIFHLLEVIWDSLDGVRLVVRENYGASAMALCRSLFEKCCAAHYLLRSGDDQVIQDYRDYGIVVAYELGQAMHAPEAWLAQMQRRYEGLKPRFMNDRNRDIHWHRLGSIRALIDAAGMGEIGPDRESMYKTFYKEASSIAHGDSYLVSQHNPERGWYQELAIPLLTEYAETALILGYSFTCDVFGHYDEQFQCGLKDDILKAYTLLLALDKERAARSGLQT